MKRISSITDTHKAARVKVKTKGVKTWIFNRAINRSRHSMHAAGKHLKRLRFVTCPL